MRCGFFRWVCLAERYAQGVTPAELDTALGKGVAVLRSFRADDRVLSLAEVVRRTGLHKATAHRLCGALVDLHLMDKVDGGYRLASGLFELGMLASLERDLLEVAIPFMQDLYQRTHETVHVGVLDGTEVVYVAKIGGHRQAKAPSRTGGRMPVHCTAIGKALLAFSTPAIRRDALSGRLERRTPHTVVAPGLLERQLKKVVELGVAFEHEESQLGITCVGAPIFEGDRLLAAVSVTGPTSRFRPEQHATAVRAAAAALGSTLTRRQGLIVDPS